VANVNISLVHACAGGSHIRINGNVNGGANNTLDSTVADLKAPLTDREIDIFMRVLVKLYTIGKTNNQIKAGLQAGFTVTIP